MAKCFLLAVFWPFAVSYGQDPLTLEPDRNVPPGEQYPELDPSNDPQSEQADETPAERGQRIKERFGDSQEAITLFEDAEDNRNAWQAEQVRETLLQAKYKLDQVNSRGISAKKRKQLAAAWGRLAQSERFLFGDTGNNLEWLRKANELDPENEDVARALGVAERKREYARARLAEAARIRATRNQQN